MEHTPGLETSPPGSDTLDVAGGAGTPAALEAASPAAADRRQHRHRAVIEQRAITMLGDEANASLSEIFPQAAVSPIGIRDRLHTKAEALLWLWPLAAPSDDGRELRSEAEHRASTGIMGARRAWTASMISALAVPWR
jgi:hypothetical protein